MTSQGIVTLLNICCFGTREDEEPILSLIYEQICEILHAFLENVEIRTQINHSM